MTIDGSVKLDISIVLIILICSDIVRNCSGVQFFNSLDEQRLSVNFKRAQKQNSQIFNNTVFEDGIAHSEINELNPNLSEIRILEDAFKNILAMNGVKYIYKRNFYWRTWRQVEDSDGNAILVCYRCQNGFNVICTSCNCGYWEIEENPPCPFEVVSVVNNSNICVAYYNQLKNSNVTCPSIVKFTDLATCDNPLETRWRISRQHDNMNFSERRVNVICKPRENCELLTIYTIFPDHITFRIINSSNYIIYSRVMKIGNKNYVCLNNCGLFNSIILPPTKLQYQKRLSFSESKNSTENVLSSEKSKEDTTTNQIRNSNTVKPNFSLKIHTNILHFFNSVTTAATLHCKQLQHMHSEEDYEESEYNDY